MCRGLLEGAENWKRVLEKMTACITVVVGCVDFSLPTPGNLGYQHRSPPFDIDNKKIVENNNAWMI